jgi:hypothetical protein
MDVRTFFAENPDPYSYEVVVIDDPGLRMYAAAVFDGQDWIFVFVPFEFRFEGPIQAGFWSDGVILILPDSEDGWHHRLKFDPFDPSGPQWWLHSIPPYSSP